MLKHFERMRAKSDSFKKKYALFMSLGITFVICAVWITTLPARLAAIRSGSDKAAVIDTVSIKQASKDISDSFSDLKDGLSNSIPEEIKNPTTPVAASAEVAPSKTVETPSDYIIITDPSQEGQIQ